MTVSWFRIADGVGFARNWDSPHFLALARDPRLLLAAGEPRQSRPLFVVAAAGLRACLAPFFPERPSGMEAEPGYAAYVSLNFVAVWLAMTAFQGLLPGPGWPLGVFLVSALFVANDVVKAFFWVPHTQMCNLLVPVVAMAWCRHLLTRPVPRRGTALALGVAAGALTLCYGSFLVLLPAAVVVMELRRRQGAEHVGHATAALAAGAVVVPLAWIGVVTAVAGRFYSDEIGRFRQFVWPIDLWRAGLLGRVLPIAIGWFTRATAEALAFPLALLAAVLAAAHAEGVRIGEVAPDHRPTLVAAGVTLAVSFPFFALLGTYSPRLSWNFVPPVLVAVAAVAGAVRRRAGAVGGAAMAAGLFLAVGAWLVYEVTKRGPWM